MLFRSRDDKKEKTLIKKPKQENAFNSDELEDNYTNHSQSIPKKETKPQEPPLFVKVEKYRDLIKMLNEVKKFSREVRETLTVLEDIESSRREIMKLVRTSNQRLERTLTEIDNMLSRPKDLRVDKKEHIDEVENTISSIEKQINELKNELNQIE